MTVNDGMDKQTMLIHQAFSWGCYVQFEMLTRKRYITNLQNIYISPGLKPVREVSCLMQLFPADLLLYNPEEGGKIKMLHIYDQYH
ncbi:hypothetical protein Taro_028168 [Colocasia esculenta]|uniref:Uncharacterized protein n=1 Tax=Colocasia esculenta TaxID=4460 RepID=A0A843VTE1_COLES|nr:hypothetical protein [Colocasia esculenta]